jgi:hypothetical protein
MNRSERIIHCTTHGLDFPDEDCCPHATNAQAERLAQAVQAWFATH